MKKAIRSLERGELVWKDKPANDEGSRVFEAYFKPIGAVGMGLMLVALDVTFYYRVAGWPFPLLAYAGGALASLGAVGIALMGRLRRAEGAISVFTRGMLLPPESWRTALRGEQEFLEWNSLNDLRLSSTRNLLATVRGKLREFDLNDPDGFRRVFEGRVPARLKVSPVDAVGRARSVDRKPPDTGLRGAPLCVEVLPQPPPRMIAKEIGKMMIFTFPFLALISLNIMVAGGGIVDFLIIASFAIGLALATGWFMFRINTISARQGRGIYENGVVLGRINSTFKSEPMFFVKSRIKRVERTGRGFIIEIDDGELLGLEPSSPKRFRTALTRIRPDLAIEE